MKIRRIAATAVAAAVTAPALFLSAAPAFADTKPTAGVSQAADSPIEELKRAVTTAQAKYDAAEATYQKVQADTTALLDDENHELVLTRNKAEKESEEAAAAKAAADADLAAAETKLADAEKALAEATDEEKAKAQEVVDAARGAVTAAKDKATEAKTLADNKAGEAAAARKAVIDMRFKAFQDLDAVEKKRDAAKKELDEAKKALQDAEDDTPGDDECALDKNLAVSLIGPKKIATGSSGVFTFSMTNKGTAPYGDVGGLTAAFNVSDERIDDLKVSWSSANSPKWKPIKGEGDFFSSNAALPVGRSFDFKLKVDVDAKAPAGDGQLVAFGVSVDEDFTTCGLSKDAYANFSVVKPAKPGSGNDNGTNGGHNGNGTTGGSKGNGNASPQGGTSKTPLTNTSTTSTTTGRLASTGAGPSTLPFALAGGAAVVLGAGAMVMVRRRKAGEGA
ncbi:hypothetical protein [Streptomyces laurentii]|uniref:hypothetical protein n=1 Tax=Streptomyces laurentii TaxID=39478 RepID=UPI00369D6329